LSLFLLLFFFCGRLPVAGIFIKKSFLGSHSIGALVWKASHTRYTPGRTRLRVVYCVFFFVCVSWSFFLLLSWGIGEAWQLDVGNSIRNGKALEQIPFIYFYFLDIAGFGEALGTMWTTSSPSG
jgi:hypothetical protein